jgi:hypothetical protein
MIKPLRSSDKIVRPFKTFKTWTYKSTDLSDVILLEQIYYSPVSGGMVGAVEVLTQSQIESQWGEYFSHDELEVSTEVNQSKKYLNVYNRADDSLIARYQEIDATNLLSYESGDGVSPETQEIQKGEFGIITKLGKNTKGTFYPTGHRYYDSKKEPINFDGTYHRVVYNTIKHLFYNDYFVKHYDYNSNHELNIKNPLMLFGVESAEYHDPTVLADIDTGEKYTDRRIERRVIGDNILVLEISRKNFGEKIRPKSVKITDYSSEFEVITIEDDGFTNLITTEGVFESVHRVGMTWAEKISAPDEGMGEFDPRDFSFGEQLASSGIYFISGCPMNTDEMSESQTGSAFIYKFDSEHDTFRVVRPFVCPFTQNGLALEQRHDHNNVLLKQIGGVLLGQDYSLNDNFGGAVDLTENYCAVGSSRSHIRGNSREAPSGHVFIYERNKGGNDHWGMLNILEGLPGSEFGASVSIDGDMMAIGSPGIANGKGAVYIFRKETRTTESPWSRITDVPEGYTWDGENKKFRGYPEDFELERINESTTRWKVKGVIPDGNLLKCFSDIGTFELISGSYPTDTIVSGSIISGSYPTDTIVSGSIISGSISSGSIPSELECMCDLSTFGGEGIITHGTLKHNEEEFDSGYEPHEYSETPKQSTGDSTWVFDSYVVPAELENCESFGEKVKLTGNSLYVSTPSSHTQVCYVFEKTDSDCQTWVESYNITRDGIRNTLTQKYSVTTPEPRSKSVNYPYQYSDVDEHLFGVSIDANENYLVIGDSSDRKYSRGGTINEGGAVYIYEITSSTQIEFKHKLYGDFQAEELFTSKFGNSVSLLEDDLLVGSHCVDSSTIEVTGGDIIADDYYLGTSTLSEETYNSASGEKNAVEGRAFYYRLSSDTPTLMKKIKMNKQKESVRRQYGYSVSLSADYMYVGLPVIGNFPFSELTTFDNHGLSVVRDHKINPYETRSREAMFAHYNTFSESDISQDGKNLTGQVLAYKTESVRFSNRLQVGNVFYKNGVLVFTHMENHLKNLLRGKFLNGYEVEFLGTHTLYETEILCGVTPNEFNVSTNPTSLIHNQILYDINNDGKFDIRDLIYIYKFLTGYTNVTTLKSDEITDGEVPGGISVEHDTMWPNSDVLLTESEDAILMFFEREAENVILDDYEKTLPILKNLKDAGHFDIDNDGNSGSADAKLIIRYFKGNEGFDLVRGLLNKKSQRRIPRDIVEFLDEKTGKNNGVQILPDFERYTDLEKLIKDGKTLEAMCPYVTTIGLYSGLDLVGLAKLAKPTKITPNYPINFLIKYDG